MLPAGFEPASEARKAPILDRTRLRERNGRLAAQAINVFGTRFPRSRTTETRWFSLPSTTGMQRTRPSITELAFLVCGVLIVLVGWVADFLGLFEIASEPTGHGSSTTFPLRLFMTMFGVAFSTIGVGFENFPQILLGGDRAKRFIVALLFLGDGSLHLYAFNDHLGDLFSATFFAVFSAVQIAAAFIIPYTKYRLDSVWLAITVFLILAYVVTRTVAIWPSGFVEDVDALGIVSKLVERVTVLVLVSLVQSERASRRQAGPVPVAAHRYWARFRPRL